MRKMCKLELKKAICSRYFCIAVILGCVITLFSLIYKVNLYWRDTAVRQEYASATGTMLNPLSAMNSLYNSWIGGEPFSVGTTVFFFVFPVLAALPYGWSYCEEKANGYKRTAVVLAGRNAYFVSKYIAVFLSGAFAVTIPLIFNFVTAAMFFPAVTPVVLYDTSYGVFGQSLMSELYYSVPLLYVFCYLCIDFVFCGLLACLSFAVASVVRYKVVSVLFPMLFCLGLHFLRQFLYADNLSGYREISPLYFLRAVPTSFDVTWKIIFAEAACLLGATVLIALFWEKRREIY